MIVGNIASYPARYNILPDTVDTIAPQVDVLNVVLNDWDGSHVQPMWQRLGKYGNVAVWQAPLGHQDESKFLRTGYAGRGEIQVVFDDDILFAPDTVAVLMNGMKRHPGAIVGLHGCILRGHMPLRSYYADSPRFPASDSPSLTRRVEQDVRVDILGCCGAAWNPAEVMVEFDDFQTPGMTDIWLAVTSRRRGVEHWVVAHSGPEWCRQNPRVDNGATLCGFWSGPGPDGEPKDKMQTAMLNGVEW